MLGCDIAKGKGQETAAASPGVTSFGAHILFGGRFAIWVWPLLALPCDARCLPGDGLGLPVRSFQLSRRFHPVSPEQEFLRPAIHITVPPGVSLLRT
jgi:hypothetical protein